jgi:hypothetical protein
MISSIKVAVIAVGLFICNPVICVSHAQQAQTETEAVQLIGLAGLKDNTKGRLTVVNGTLRFIHAGGNADVAAPSIQDVVTGRDSQRVIGGTLGTLTSLAAPFGSGRALSLFRKKLDTLTVKYRDGDGSLHGVIFTMPAGNAETIKKELIALGAHTSIPTTVDPNKNTSKPSAPQEHKQ